MGLLKPTKYDLCGACVVRENAKLAGTGAELVKIAGGVNNKITCWGCGKRRFGSTYVLRKAEKK